MTKMASVASEDESACCQNFPAAAAAASDRSGDGYSLNGPSRAEVAS